MVQSSWLAIPHNARSITAPTNGIPWSGTVTVSPERRYYKVVGKLLNSRFNVLRLFSDAPVGNVHVEELFTETRVD